MIGRITPMPPIHGIRAVHSDDRNFLFFYEWVLRDLRDSTVIERRVISRYIEGRPVVFRGVESSSHDNEDSGLYPELPIEELSYVETLTLLSLSVMMMACFTMLFENFDVVYFASKHDNGSLYRSLQDVIFVTPIGTVSLMFCIFVYKYYLKRFVSTVFPSPVSILNTNFALVLEYSFDMNFRWTNLKPTSGSKFVTVFLSFWSKSALSVL